MKHQHGGAPVCDRLWLFRPRKAGCKPALPGGSWKVSMIPESRIGALNRKGLAPARQRFGGRQSSAAFRPGVNAKAPEGWRSPKPGGSVDGSWGGRSRKPLSLAQRISLLRIGGGEGGAGRMRCVLGVERVAAGRVRVQAPGRSESDRAIHFNLRLKPQKTGADLCPRRSRSSTACPNPITIGKDSQCRQTGACHTA